MCGRFTYKYYWKQLHRLMELTTPPVEFSFRYNVAPTQLAPIVRADAGSDGTIGPGGPRALSTLRWGLVPSWAKDITIGNTLINARAEGLETKPAFRAAFKRRRCIVPVSGFYEWKKSAGASSGDGATKARGTKPPPKQPYYITSATDDEPLAFAGLWEWWKPPPPEPGQEVDPVESEAVETFTIITTTPNEMMAHLHDRMPVILDRADFAAWLDPANADAASLLALLKPYPPELLRGWPVSARVNSPKLDDPSCIDRVGDVEPTPDSPASAGPVKNAEGPTTKITGPQRAAKRRSPGPRQTDQGELWSE